MVSYNHPLFKYKNFILIILMLFFLFFSFYPTIYEVKESPKLKLKHRDFVLEHNYYWPDFNLYLSKIRQGYENRFFAVEKYTSEPHSGSLIQVFYLWLGKLGSIFSISPNYTYQLGRLILSPLLLIVILLFTSVYFRSEASQIFAFVITVISGSFPRIYQEGTKLHLTRYMEWWSNIDSLQRITFIPHILFGQVVSFYLLYVLTIKKSTINYRLSTNKLIFYIILANLAGLVFPPSEITLLATIFILTILGLLKYKSKKLLLANLKFLIFSLPSLLYFFIITKQIPWSTLVIAHRLNPMMVPLDQYLLGTGPVIFLGFIGSLIAIIKRRRKYYPLIIWVAVTFLFAAFFSVVREQSPLRFTQTGIFIPLGILTAFTFKELYGKINTKLFYLIIFAYIILCLIIMYNSLLWQITFINQRVGADIPAVPYPPQTMYPQTDWMKGIYWLHDNTNSNDVVIAEITAGNFIPAYAGNFVYFGQTNTVDYNRKIDEVDRFFKGQMGVNQAEIFLKNGGVKYIFVGPQEAEKLGGRKLETVYPFVKTLFKNDLVTIYSVQNLFLHPD